MRLQSSRVSWPGLRELGWVPVLLGLLLAACGGDGKGKWGKGNEAEIARPDPLVEVLDARKDNISSIERSNGRIEARNLADVYAQVSEVCVELLHDVGDHVKRDQVLAKLDPARLNIQQAAALLAVDEATLTHNRNKLDHEKRKADLERIQKYFNPEKPEESRVFTKEAYDAAKLEADKAANSVQSSQLALNKATGEAAAVALQLGHTEIKAPISGVITERNIRANELIASGTVAFRMVDLTLLEVKLDVAEASIAGIRAPRRVEGISLFGLESKVDFDTAQAAFLSVTAYPEERFLGYVDRISPTVDQARGMVAVTVRVLLPGDVSETRHAGLLSKLDPKSRDDVLATARRARPAAEPAPPESGAQPPDKPARRPGREGPARPARDAQPPIELKPGMFVEARIATRLVEGAILISGAALASNEEVIWKIDLDKDSTTTGTARRVDVQGRRGIAVEGLFELKPAGRGRDEGAEIKPGDKIVVRGHNLLRDGQKVRVRELARELAK